MNEQVPGENVSQFSDAWVKQKGLPTILTTYQDGYLVVSQIPPTGTTAFWRQQFDVRLIYDFEKSRTIEVNMRQPITRIKLNSQPSSIIPNYSGRGFGHFTLDDAYIKKLPLRIMVTRDDLNRYALLLTTFDNYKMGRIPASYFGELYRDMLKEKNQRIMQLVVDQMMEIARDRSALSERQTLEQCVMDLLPENRRPECRQTIIRKMATSACSPQVLNQLYGIWQAQSDPLFDEHDYMEMEFDFVSRACNPDQKVRQELASSLKKSQHEAWAKHALELLNTK